MVSSYLSKTQGMEYSGLVQGNSENEMGRKYAASGVLLRVYAVLVTVVRRSQSLSS